MIFKKNLYVIYFFLTLVSAAVNSSCSNSDDTAQTDPEVRVQVTLTRPERNTVSEYMQFNGVTQFQKKDNIRATQTGYVTGINFRPGNYIQTGSVFCEIVTKEQRALRNLSDTDSSLQKFQVPLPVESNASGIISVINVLSGDYVNEGDLIATVLEPGSLVLNLNVPYEFHNFISNGKRVEILLPDGKSIISSISNSMPTVDPVTLSQVYLINLADYSLPENLLVTVRIAVDQKANVLTLPVKAVQTDEEQKEFWVMKLENDSMAVRIPVFTGTQNDTVIQVISDKITSEDRIIVDGAYELPDSATVKIQKGE
ncbi:MAG: HlyD family efflux transporter periplasmic adaptor subunit [Bacteroidetes bacterium]|nr:HlyD family efflux transporter periplasmic adaptor subunit [Bacteroidota bacterium]